MSYNPYPWAYSALPNTSVPIAGQTESTYLNWKKTQEFDNVGWFLTPYVVEGGYVTKNVKQNDRIDISLTEFVLDNALQQRQAIQGIKLKNPNSTYFVDIYQGDYWVDTSHPSGTVGQDYLTLATVTTDSIGNINSITDTAGLRGGFRLKSQYGLNGYLKGITSVKDFGAVGDGVTDDYQAFEDAVSVCPAGGVVFLPEPANKYRLSRSLVISKPIKVVGFLSVYEVEGNLEKTTVIEFDNTVKVGINVTSYSVELEGFGVSMLRTASDTVAAIYFQGQTSSDIRNCVVRNVNTRMAHIYGAGIKCNGCITTTIDNVKTSQGQYGFYFDSPSGNGTSVTFYRTWAMNYTSGGAAYYLDNYDYCQFINTACDSVNSPDYGYWIKNGDGISFTTAASEKSKKSSFFFDNCSNVTLTSCFGYMGNAGGTGSANASFAELTNGTKFVTLISCTDYASSGYTTPNVYCDSTSIMPIAMNCDFPKGMSENGTVVLPYNAANTKSYMMIGRSVLIDSPAGTGVMTLTGRQFGSGALRMGVMASNFGSWLGYIEADGGFVPRDIGSLPPASSSYRGRIYRVQGGTGTADGMYYCRKTATETYEWAKLD